MQSSFFGYSQDYQNAIRLFAQAGAWKPVDEVSCAD
jgi:hypothetical protein